MIFYVFASHLPQIQTYTQTLTTNISLTLNYPISLFLFYSNQALAAGPSTVPPSSINSHISHISPKPVVTQKDTNSTTGSINGSINGSNTNTSTGPINGSIQPGSALAAIGSQGASLKQGLFIFVLVLCAFFSALFDYPPSSFLIGRQFLSGWFG